MKRVLMPLTALFLFVPVVGCAIFGPTRFSQSSLSMATMSKNNFRIVKAGIRGESSGFSLLFIPIVWPSASDAKQEMYDQLYKEGFALEGKALALANTTEDRGGINFLLFALPKLTLTADVIEFLDEKKHDSTDSNVTTPPVSEIK